MGISRGGGAMFRRVPVWLNIVGGLILVTQVSALAILPFESDDGHTTDGKAVEAEVKSTVTVLYLLTGTAKSAYTTVINDTGGEEKFREQAVPMRRPYEMRKGAEARLFAITDDGDVTCTLVMDGIIVAQQRGTTVDCTGNAGEEKAHSGAVMPTEEQLLPEPAPTKAQVNTKVMKLPKYPGKASPIKRRVTDDYAGISYAELGNLWGPNRESGQDGFSRTQTFEVADGWLAEIRSGRVSPALLEVRRSGAKNRDAAFALLDDLQDHGFPDGTTGKDVVSQKLTIDGRAAWVAAREMHYTKDKTQRMELSHAVVIDTGQVRPTFVIVSIPDEQRALWPDINRIISSINVLS